MKNVHVKNIEKYLPAYKDRALAWFKIYFRDTMDGEERFRSFFDDAEIEMLLEVDRYRYLSLIAMEAQLGRPVPMDKKRLIMMGWNTKKRSIELTLNALHGLLEVRNEKAEILGTHLSVTEIKNKEKEEEKYKEEEEKEGNNHKSVTGKKKFAEFVEMTDQEFTNLTKKVGSEDAALACVEILDNYLAEPKNQRRYTSHYRAILRWVVDEMHEKIKRGTLKFSGRPAPPTLRCEKCLGTIPEKYWDSHKRACPAEQ